MLVHTATPRITIRLDVLCAHWICGRSATVAPDSHPVAACRASANSCRLEPSGKLYASRKRPSWSEKRHAGRKSQARLCHQSWLKARGEPQTHTCADREIREVTKAPATPPPGSGAFFLLDALVRLPLIYSRQARRLRESMNRFIASVSWYALTMPWPFAVIATTAINTRLCTVDDA